MIFPINTLEKYFNFIFIFYFFKINILYEMAFNKQQKISSFLSNNELSPNNGSAIQPNIFNPLQPLMGQATKGMLDFIIFFFSFSNLTKYQPSNAWLGWSASWQKSCRTLPTPDEVVSINFLLILACLIFFWVSFNTSFSLILKRYEIHLK